MYGISFLTVQKGALICSDYIMTGTTPSYVSTAPNALRLSGLPAPELSVEHYQMVTVNCDNMLQDTNFTVWKAPLFQTKL